MTHTFRPNFDAVFCGQQPLHQTNLIQPHGALIVADKSNLQILQVSENIAELLGADINQVINQPLESFVTNESYSEFRLKSRSSFFTNKVPVSITFLNNGEPHKYVSTVHEKDEALLIEVEFKDIVTEAGTLTEVFQQLQYIISVIDSCETVKEVCSISAKEIKKLSGFDKVMIYSFDDEWNGTVIAEEKEQEMDTYLGLKFPASDIPKPARDLYFKNSYRFIPNRGYKPVKLVPDINPITRSFTNLSQSKLRSVAEVHLEYLKNMDINASMSTRIIYNERLWGLISCHHRSPKFLSFHETGVFELLSNTISAKISSLISRDLNIIKQRANEYYVKLVEQVHMYDSLASGLLNNKETTLQLLHAEGVAICWNETIEVIGLTPETHEIESLRRWLKKKTFTRTLHLPALPHAFNEASSYADIASGIVILPIQADLGNFILAFRPEAVKKVSWGGNPNEPIKFDASGSGYHPRNSFQKWKETVRNTSEAWTPEELEIIEKFRNFLVEYTLQHKNRELEWLYQEFKFLTDFIPQLVWSTRPDGYSDFFNRRWSEYTGIKFAAGQSENVWQQVVHPEDFERVRPAWRAALNGSFYEIECRLRKYDGTYNWFLAIALPLKDDFGKVIKWFGSCTDISHLKAIEDLLEQKVQERTIELQKSNIDLELSNAELLQFASVTSHDLQEPVRKIITFCNIIQEKFGHTINEDARRYLDRIAKSSARMRNLIVDLLDLSRLSNTQVFQKTNLNTVVADVLSDLELMITEKDALIITGDMPTIDAVPGQMRQLFQNFISNSLKFSRKDVRPEIKIAAEKISEPSFESPVNENGAFCRITIADNGIGFEQKYVEKIFMIFQRLSSKEQYEGTGIGLAIIKKILEKHNGIIAASGVPNQGATFTIVLPLQNKLQPSL